MPKKVLSNERVADSDLETASDAGSSVASKVSSASSKRKANGELKGGSKRSKIEADTQRDASIAVDGSKNSTSKERSPTSTRDSSSSGENSRGSSVSGSGSGSDDGDESEKASSKSSVAATSDSGEENGSGSESESQRSSTSSKSPAPSKSPTPARETPANFHDKAARPRNSNGKSTGPPRAPEVPYAPPAGFVPTTASSDDNDEIRKLLATANLEGKQIWHITAPASVPLSSLTTLDLDQAQRGASVFTHKDTDYGFIPSKTDSTSSARLLTATEAGDAYCAVPRPFDRTFHVQQLIREGLAGVHDRTASNGSQATALNASHAATSNSSQAPASPFVPARREQVQQPPGLRTRYWPPGFERGMEKTFVRPEMLEHDSSQARPGVVEGVAESQTNGKKDKLGKRDHLHGSSSQDANGTQVNGSQSKETKEERRTRKEKKRSLRVS